MRKFSILPLLALMMLSRGIVWSEEQYEYLFEYIQLAQGSTYMRNCSDGPCTTGLWNLPAIHVRIKELGKGGWEWINPNVVLPDDYLTELTGKKYLLLFKRSNIFQQIDAMTDSAEVRTLRRINQYLNAINLELLKDVASRGAIRDSLIEESRKEIETIRLKSIQKK